MGFPALHRVSILACFLLWAVSFTFHCPPCSLWPFYFTQLCHLLHHPSGSHPSIVFNPSPGGSSRFFSPGRGLNILEESSQINKFSLIYLSILPLVEVVVIISPFNSSVCHLKKPDRPWWMTGWQSAQLNSTEQWPQLQLLWQLEQINIVFCWWYRVIHSFRILLEKRIWRFTFIWSLQWYVFIVLPQVYVNFPILS